MEFGIFHSACRYMYYGIVDGFASKFEPTCRRKDRIPKGSSWGRCSKELCPYFGEIIHATNIRIILADGTVLECPQMDITVVYNQEQEKTMSTDKGKDDGDKKTK